MADRWLEPSANALKEMLVRRRRILRLFHETPLNGCLLGIASTRKMLSLVGAVRTVSYSTERRDTCGSKDMGVVQAADEVAEQASSTRQSMTESFPVLDNLRSRSLTMPAPVIES